MGPAAHQHDAFDRFVLKILAVDAGRTWDRSRPGDVAQRIGEPPTDLMKIFSMASMSQSPAAANDERHAPTRHGAAAGVGVALDGVEHVRKRQGISCAVPA